jgi:two-component system, OmpR family, response regulator RegX3
LVTDVTNASGPSVLLVEDEQAIAEPFAAALRRNGFRPTVVRTGLEALRHGRQDAPDIVLLDLALPDMDGRDVCRELRRDSAVPIIMVTARGTVTDRVVGLELGADDYIVKPFATGEAISRIRAVLRRTHHGPGNDGAPAGEPRSAPASREPEQLSIEQLRVDPSARRAFVGSRELELTRKELDLLMRLVRDAGRVVSRETLMSEVWDENWFGSTKTLDVHMASLRRKLGDRPAGGSWIETVRGVGFRFASPGERHAPQARQRDAGARTAG